MALTPQLAEPPPPPPTDASNDASDVKSPTTLVLNFLRSKGMQPTGGNIRTVLEQNAREPGYIPGLGNDAPGTDIGRGGETGPAGMRGAGGGRTSDAPPDRRGSGDDPKTSAPPSSGDTGDLTGLGAAIATGLGLGGLGYGASRLFGRGGGAADVAPGGVAAEAAGNVDMGPTGRVTDIGPPAIAGNAPPQLTGPQGQLPGPEVSPMEQALQKALAPPGPPSMGGPTVSPDLGNVMPVDPMNVIGSGKQLPPGVTDLDAARAGAGDLGRTDGPMRNMPLPLKSTTPRGDLTSDLANLARRFRK